MYTLPLHAATSVVANNALPQGGNILAGDVQIPEWAKPGGTNPAGNLEMNITQNTTNGVISWGSFDVGGSATVNFKGPESGYNTLNYVNAGGSMSQIYGTINANNSGNIFIVNTAGVQIGNSAQINVGSLYVSNNEMSNADFTHFMSNADPKDIINYALQGNSTNAALMSLGNINANKVTFEGDGRIVIDSERITNDANNATFRVNTNDAGNVLIGYDAYVETDKDKDGFVDGYKGQDKTFSNNVYVNGKLDNTVKGYMWVEDVDQLQAINTNLGGNYALRNSIDATGTAQNSFNPIGLDDSGKVIVNDGKYGFSGNFDGIDYNIFGLNINKSDKTNVGLFGVAHDANINNVTLVGGSITGGSVVGSVVGAALGNTHITNATNSASVTGNTDVGGIVGYSGNEISDGDNGNIIVNDTDSHFTNLVNTGTVHSKGERDENGEIVSNSGGLIGYMYNGKLDGNSYNLGDVSGKGYNVGGLVGHAVNSTIGDGTNLVYNRLDVEGAYNVGGIVGNMKGTTVQNAENSGNVTASGYTTEKYTYHTGERNQNNIPTNGILNNDGTVTTSVNVANVGGIAGTASNNSTIEDVTNSADVSSNTSTYTLNSKQNIYYTAGNVGGIVGRAENTDINNATNKENTIRGAHNVGGVAGYFGNTDDADKIYTVNTGINDGGDIMATGARNSNGFVKELVRPVGDSNESFIIGNIGGIVGYMDGDDVFVTASGNRGTVHSQDIAQEDAVNVLDTSKAANVGGVVGKIDRSDTKDVSEIKLDESKAAVSSSYNTGDVRGYTGVGGVVGMMYNGEVAGSYNLGNLRTTRIANNSSNIEAVNMGGIVGDTTEGSRSQGVVIYDVYNKGQIGDDTYTYYARHVAGIVGRLSGEVEKAYNNGEIYNGYTATGGIAGWMYEGSIKNAFNTGNITVYNHDSSTSQVGGIVGAASVGSGDINLTNVYNLGTLRSFEANQQQAQLSHTVGDNAIGGIIGAVMSNSYSLNISGAYTTGNIYAGIEGSNGAISLDKSSKHIGSISGENRNNADINRTNTYYIKPQPGIDFTELGTFGYGQDNSNKAIDYGARSVESSYQYIDETGYHKLSFSSQSGGNVTGDTDDNRRLYGDTPILNAFLPDSEKYFDQYGDDSTLKYAGMDKVQYGTAYDPLLTIVTANENANGNLSFNFGNGDNELSISNAAGLVVNGAGVTINNFTTSGGSGYFGGLLYSEGVLTINAAKGEGLGLGSASQIYGSSVRLTADGTITVYGDVVATGNGTQTTDNPDEAGSINITSNKGDVNVYGTLTSAQDGENVVVPGISATADAGWKPADSVDKLNDPKAHLNTIGDRFEVNTVKSNVGGNINITANGVKNDNGELTSGGNVNLYYGNKQEGLITTGGDLTVTGEGDVYVDSDLAIGGDLTLTGNGENSEVVLDLTNIGQVQAKNGTVDDAANGLHDFMHHFNKNDANGANINLNAEKSKDAKITVDMWDGNAFNLEKFDSNGHNFKNELNFMNVTINGNKLNGTEGNHVKDYTYIWVSDGEQLQGINATANDDGLDFNYALKGDINASDVENYIAIGTGSQNGFTGIFDGRGNRIIGLKVNNNGNAGIFSTVGTTGVVKNVNIYSGNFSGSANAGAVAGVNNGRIENIVTFGNTVTSDGNAGGIVGVNNSGSFDANGGTLSGGIYDVESTGSVIAGSSNAIAGGLVGTNEGGLANSFSDSAVTVETGITLDKDTTALGGVVGVNKGDVQLVDSLGVTNGGSTGSSNVGGIIGTNNGNMYSGYNESIVSGSSNVGGIIGQNDGGTNYTVDTADGTITWNKGTVENVVNATGVTGSSNYVGGLVGTNTGSVTNGRNNGTITGNNYVGGLVGDNADEHSILTNLVNDSSAEILGEQYVGGIAGSNSGKISATNDGLTNRGSITGNKFVGGVAGVNTGEIANTISSIVLNAKGNGAQFFGGVVGQNSGLINGATNTSDINITAVGGSFVGGIIGQNNNDKVLQGTETDRLIVANDGTVDANEGGAAGIFYENNGDIKYADISNSGDVDGGDKDGGTGGLFGINTGNITESTLTNSGTVSGGGNVGGLIGVNSGNADNSSLTNTGSVTGINNVGGLIGENTGTITGGRDDNNSYYKDQIYNNGTITGRENGSNIGGLIGYNTVDNTDPDNIKTGSLTAGYNTGAINAGSSTNVGGIVGNNAGNVDQVFNTVMTGVDDKGNTLYGTITGKDNVGGLVGTNSGALSNAYNTTGVEGAKGSTGNAVGVNTNKVENIYGYSKLVGNGNEATNSYIINNSDEWKKQEKYIGFDFTTSDNTPAIWKNYDGYSNPLLKVFLTKAGYKGDEKFTYNATDQGLTINSNTITAADELDAYNNANSLLTATQNKNAGEGYLGIYSQQIAASGKGDTFDPNNLGYDIDATYDIKKAQINISLDEINRVYGNATISNNTQNSIKNEFGYGFTYEIENINDTMREELVNNGIVFEQTYDGAVYGVSGNKVTNDAGDYTWSANFELKNDNYEFINGQENISYDGVSKVNRAEITVDLNEVIRDYGNTAIKNNGGNYTASINGLVNGDNELGYTSDNLNITVTSDGALTGNSSGKVTGDAGDHIWTAEVTGKDGQTLTNLSKNYNITVKNSGKSTVNKAQIHIGANAEAIHVGEAPDYTGTDINGALVNGDKLSSDYHYGVADSAIESVVDIHNNAIGVWIGNTFYDLSTTVDWTKVDGFFSNYKVTYKPGTLTVTEQVMPDLPDNWPNNRWDYLFADNPFDRNENFRERKAEVNFVDGAMEI